MAIPSDDNMSDIISNPEELYNNLGDIDSYVQDNSSLVGSLVNLPNTFRTVEGEPTMDLKQEILYGDFNFSTSNTIEEHLQNQLPPVFTNAVNVCNEEYAGPHDFDVYIVPNESKSPWVFSPALNKVFIDMNAYFPVDFRLLSRPKEDLYIRVMPCFSSLQHSQDLVFRCVQHEQLQLNKNIADHVRQHIIRVSNPDAHYLGDKNYNQRLSILFPLKHPQTGAEAVREMFVFVCKNSCPGGMNRKPIEIVFTLERFDGVILGRRILNVRICSCPKRDKEKEEKDYMSKGAPYNAKKRKLEGKHEKGQSKSQTGNVENDKNIYTVTLEIAGKHNVQQVIKYSQDLMAGEMVRHPQNNETYATCFKNLQEKQSKLLQ